MHYKVQRISYILIMGLCFSATIHAMEGQVPLKYKWFTPYLWLTKSKAAVSRVVRPLTNLLQHSITSIRIQPRKIGIVASVGAACAVICWVACKKLNGLIAQAVESEKAALNKELGAQRARADQAERKRAQATAKYQELTQRDAYLEQNYQAQGKTLEDLTTALEKTGLELRQVKQERDELQRSVAELTARSAQEATSVSEEPVQRNVHEGDVREEAKPAEVAPVAAAAAAQSPSLAAHESSASEAACQDRDKNVVKSQPKDKEIGMTLRNRVGRWIEAVRAKKADDSSRSGAAVPAQKESMLTASQVYTFLGLPAEKRTYADVQAAFKEKEGETERYLEQGSEEQRETVQDRLAEFAKIAPFVTTEETWTRFCQTPCAVSASVL